LPELNKANIKMHNTANPGCFATATIGFYYRLQQKDY
jgi:N-acetyl-gamma-glutamylphosphate reductase